MSKFWMISDREVKRDGLGKDRSRKETALSFWTSEGGALDDLGSWTPVDSDAFRRDLGEAAEGFPLVEDPAQHERQKHVTLFVHGFNTTWEEAARRYRKLCRDLFAPGSGLGICVLFTWPSDGMPTNYLPDRADARACAPDLAEVLCLLYDWMLVKQRMGASDRSKACRAKTSIVAHSMGNYVLQNAMQLAWTRYNRPLLVSLVNQLVMVAADVDNDLFGSGDEVSGGEGEGIANLTYRVTALYTGRDSVLGMSAGLKHFGKRRLGRSGLDGEVGRPDNVWDIDCSRLIPSGADDVHSAYFEHKRTVDLMRELLRGVDRGVLRAKGLVR